eukprot:6213242-Pleurochrysis_carterae.AAC.2
MGRVYAASGGPLAPCRRLVSRRGIYENDRLHRSGITGWSMAVDYFPVLQLALKVGRHEIPTAHEHAVASCD